MSRAKQELQSWVGSKPEEYDLLVRGSGAAGKLISWTLAKKGMKTAVIERKYVGGHARRRPALSRPHRRTGRSR